MELNAETISAIRAMRGKYKGHRCFLAGNGPSLASTPLELLKDEYTFGVNKIADIYKMTTWRPSFYVNVANGVVFPPQRDACILAARDAISFLCVDNLQHLYGVNDDGVCKITDNIYPLKVTFRLYDPTEIDSSTWSYDISDHVSKDGCSMYSVFQIAVYLGFDPLILIGCDLGHKGFIWEENKDPNHFTEDYWERLTIDGGKPYRITDQYAKKQARHIRSAHIMAQEVCDKMGVKIYNATLGGELEVHQRVDFEDIL